jgi:hypothetical protein
MTDFSPKLIATTHIELTGAPVIDDVQGTGFKVDGSGPILTIPSC